MCDMNVVLGDVALVGKTTALVVVPSADKFTQSVSQSVSQSVVQSLL